MSKDQHMTRTPGTHATSPCVPRPCRPCRLEPRGPHGSQSRGTRGMGRAAGAAVALLSLTAAPALAAEVTNADAAGLVANLPRLLGRLHPVLVHFPIALLIAAVLFEVVAIVVKRERSRPSAAGLACVVVGTLGAGVAAWAGWINADLEPHGRGVADLLLVHRWLGISAACLAGVALLGALFGATGKARGMTALYRVALVLAAGAVGAAGHWGGSIVYGGGYLTEVLFPKPVPPEPNIETQLAELEAAGTTLTVDFATQIAPIFADHCVKCHGPDKSKGDLRLDARRYVFDDRDADAQVILPGDAFNSDLHFRITLPRDDEDAMPPEGKGDPLSPEQVAMVETWINEGAVWSDVPIVAPVTVAAETTTDTERPNIAPAEPAFTFDEAAQARQAAAFEALRERGAVALRISASEPWAEVRFDLLGAGVTDADLALLEPLKPTLASLNLSGTGVTDAGVAALGEYPRLARLNLGRTAVTDDGIASLTSLRELHYLNLYATGVTDRGLVSAASLPALESLYLWGTRVSPQAGALLAALRPGLAVEVGAEVTPADFTDVPEVAAGQPEPPIEAEASESPEPEPEIKIELAALPDCCRAAVEAGGECDHPCCVEARAAGVVCAKCLGN